MQPTKQVLTFPHLDFSCLLVGKTRTKNPLFCEVILQQVSYSIQEDQYLCESLFETYCIVSFGKRNGSNFGVKSFYDPSLKHKFLRKKESSFALKWIFPKKKPFKINLNFPPMKEKLLLLNESKTWFFEVFRKSISRSFFFFSKVFHFW